ncbi:MAG: IS1182 family transposase [Peptococcaceae bacterium]|nr:IS1182 family transposase [Peptococcaceae bacterium]
METWEGRPLVRKDSIYYALSQADDIFRDDLFSGCYASCGRPSVRPSLLIKVMLLQFFDNVSDREAEQRALYDIRWKKALGVPLGESGFDYSLLSKFRTRLLFNRKERLIFDTILDVATSRGLVPKGFAKQIIDSTCTFGAGAVQDTYTLITKAIRKALHELGGRLGIRLKDLNIDYGSKSKIKIDWNNSSEREIVLNMLHQDAEKIIAAAQSLQLSEEEAGLLDLLSMVTSQDIEQNDDGTVKIKKGVAKDRVISTTDPDMRHGRKSNSRLFDGYKTHSTEEKETEFITGVEVTAGNAHDSEAVSPLLDSQPVARRPEELSGDGAYGTGANRKDMKERKILLISPVPEPSGRDGCYPKSMFGIDIENETCQCPAGEYAQEEIHDKKTGELKVFLFSEKQCNNCPFRDQCTKNKKGRRTITINKHEKYLQEGRAFQETEKYQTEYPERCKIERKQSEMVRHGLRKARYIGLAKVRLQALFIAALVNMKRYWKLLNQQDVEENSTVKPLFSTA